MQITHFIELSGPLSRNERLRALKAGDTFYASVLEKTSEKEALLNLFGNKVKAHFEKGLSLNAGRSLQLEIVGTKQGMLHFKVVDGGKAGSTLGDLLFLKSSEMLPFLRTLPHALIDLFLFRLQLEEYKQGKRFKDPEFLFTKLRARGIAQADISSLAATISSHAKNGFLASILSILKELKLVPTTYSNESSHEELPDRIFETFSKEESLYLLDLVAQRDYSSFYLDIDKTPYKVTVLNGTSSMLVSVEFSQSGRIEIVGREEQEALFLNIFIEDREFQDAFENRKVELMRSLQNPGSKKLMLQVYSRSEAAAALQKEYEQAVMRPLFDAKA